MGPWNMSSMKRFHEGVGGCWGPFGTFVFQEKPRMIDYGWGCCWGGDKEIIFANSRYKRDSGRHMKILG